MLLTSAHRLVETAQLALAPVFRVSWLVFGLSLLATMIAWRFLVANIDATAQEAFDDLMLSFSGELNRSITAYEQMLSGAAALVYTRPALTRGEFRSYLQAIRFDQRFPGLQGIGYSAIFPTSERESIESKIRSEGFKDFAVHPAGDRDELSAIIFVEPFDWRNRRTFGYDMLSEPVRRAAMERARDTGQPAASGAVKLKQETESDVQAGFLMYLPIYKSGQWPKTQAARRSSIKGFVYSPFRIGNLIEAVLEREGPKIKSKAIIEVVTGGRAGNATIVYKSAPNVSGNEQMGLFVNTSSLDVHGTPWHVMLTSTPAFERSVDYTPAWLALVTGVLLSALLSGLVASAALRQRETSINNTRMELLARELAHRVKNSLAVVQSIANRSLVDHRPLSEAREVFSQRLHALARAHSHLVENSWRGVSMLELASAEVQPFGARATLQGPNVSMNADAAQLFALVVHELATNAVKHGALSTESGRVEMRWWIKGEKGNETLCFRWKESGGPEVQEPTSKGFGQTLLKQAIVHGAIHGPETIYAKDGLSYEFEVPLETVQEEAARYGRQP